MEEHFSTASRQTLARVYNTRKSYLLDRRLGLWQLQYSKNLAPRAIDGPITFNLWLSLNN